MDSCAGAGVAKRRALSAPRNKEKQWRGERGLASAGTVNAALVTRSRSPRAPTAKCQRLSRTTKLMCVHSKRCLETRCKLACKRVMRSIASQKILRERPWRRAQLGKGWQQIQLLQHAHDCRARRQDSHWPCACEREACVTDLLSSGMRSAWPLQGCALSRGRSLLERKRGGDRDSRGLGGQRTNVHAWRQAHSQQHRGILRLVHHEVQRGGQRLLRSRRCVKHKMTVIALIAHGVGTLSFTKRGCSSTCSLKREAPWAH